MRNPTAEPLACLLGTRGKSEEPEKAWDKCKKEDKRITSTSEYMKIAHAQFHNW